MPPDSSSEKKSAHVISVRLGVFEFTGQGLGIFGVVVVVLAIFVICKPEIVRLIDHVKPAAKIADVSK